MRVHIFLRGVRYRNARPTCEQVCLNINVVVTDGNEAGQVNVMNPYARARARDGLEIAFCGVVACAEIWFGGKKFLVPMLLDKTIRSAPIEWDDTISSDAMRQE